MPAISADGFTFRHMQMAMCANDYGFGRLGWRVIVCIARLAFSLTQPEP